MDLFNVFLLLFGLLIVAAIFTQFLIRKPRPARFFSYYTILSNLFTGIVLIIAGLDAIPTIQNELLGEVTVYMLITGLGFTILLKGDNDEDGLIPWINILLHYLVPFALFIGWIIFHGHNIPFQTGLWWLIPLLTYLIFTLVRGSVTGWYPYHFFNPAKIGVKNIILHIIGLTLATIGLIYIVTWISSFLR